MRKLGKKILTGCSALMMAFVFSVPTYAAGIQPRYTLERFST